MKKTLANTSVRPKAKTATSPNNLISDSRIILPPAISKSRASNLQGFSRHNVRIADVFMLYAQKKLMSVIDEKEMYSRAYEEIRPLVEKHGLEQVENVSRDMLRKNTKTINSLLSQKVRELVVNALSGENRLVIEFADFVNRLEIPALKRKGGGIYLNRLYKMLQDSQTKAVLNCRFETWREEKGELLNEVEFLNYHLVPTWKIVIKGEEETGVHFESFEALIKSQKKNKEQYIKRIEFNFNTEAMAVFALPRIESGYSITDSKYKVGFGKYAFQLDWIVRSKYKMQHMRNGNYYLLEELYKMFGTKYAYYKDFKARVLLSAIEEINNAGDIFVTFREEKEGKKVVGIEFCVRRNFGGDRNEDGTLLTFPLSYFIACKHYYSRRYVALDHGGFSSFDEYYGDIKEFARNFYKNMDVQYYQDENDLTLQDWKHLYDQELLAWQDLSHVYNEHRVYFAKKGWVLDSDKLGIIEDVSGEYISPFKSVEGVLLELPSEQLTYLSDLLEAK